MSLAAAATLFVGLLTSCSDADLPADNTSKYTDGVGLSFVISLNNLDGGSLSRAHSEAPGEGFENYIQLNGVKNGLRVLIFTKQGKFRYRVAVDPTTAKPIEGGYEITISENLLLSDTHGEEIIRMIKEDGFKIAVLANWPLEQIDGNHFEWDEDMGKLSHFRMDPNIDDQFDIYSHILQGSKGNFLSSCNTVWIRDFTAQHGKTKNRYDDRIKHGYWRYYYDEINEYIKRGKGDDEGGYFVVNEDDHTIDFYRRLDDLNEYKIKEVWRNWDFSGGQNPQAYYVSKNSTESTPFKSRMTEWNSDFVEALKKVCTPSGSNYTYPTYKTFEYQGLTFHTSQTQATFVPYNGTPQSGYLEFASVPAVEQTKAGAYQNKGDSIPYVVGGLNGVLAFNIPADVTVRVKASSPDGAYLYMSWIDQANTSASTRFDWWFVSGASPEEPSDGHKTRRLTTTPEYFELTMNPSNQLFFPVYIVGQGGKIRIHEIEFVKDVHLYDCDSAAQLPSAENPIPMYGVQDFDPIGNENYENTPDGQTFPLSTPCDWADYDYKRVYLLRSVAKVEVYFPKTVFKNHKPSHIYMRTMNSSANCETVDVKTPTDLLWYGENTPVLKDGVDFWDDIAPKYTGTQGRYLLDNGIDDEWDNIMGFCPMHDGSTDKSGAEYMQKLAWFYGSWQDWGWNWNGTSFKYNNATGKGYKYPRVFNPRIEGYSNNNYVRLIEVEDPTGQYYKYICYSPEKLPDDTDINGDLTSRAKVQHIEMHFDGPQDNLDDNYAYRLYFINYAVNGKYIDNGRQGYDDGIEKSTDYLKYIYPIVRNHVYRFYVTGFNSDKTTQVRLAVESPRDRETSITIQ